MNPEERKGKKIIETIIVVFLLQYLGLLILPYLNVQDIEIHPTLITVILTLILCYFLHRGSEWARYLATLFLTIGALSCGLGIILTASFQPITFMLLMLTVIYGMMADQLLLSKAVKAYFLYRNFTVKTK